MARKLASLILLLEIGWLESKNITQDIEEGSPEDFLNKMGLGDPDPSTFKSGFDSV